MLLKLLVLEEEREMLARPFSFNLMKGLRGTGGQGLVTRRTEGRQASHRLRGSHGTACWLLCPESSQIERCLEQRPVPGPKGLKPALPHPHSYFSLLGQISGELGLDEVSDFIS